MMTFAEHTAIAVDMVFRALERPPIGPVFAWDGHERLVQVGNDRFTLYVDNPVALAEGLLRMGCPEDEITPELAEAFAATVLRDQFRRPWTVRADRLQGWVRRWNNREDQS